MTKSLRIFGLLSLAWLWAFAGIARADDISYGQAAGAVVVPAGLSSEEVQKCIIEAAAGRGWRIVSKDDSKVVIMLEQEKWVSKLTLEYTNKDIQIYSKTTKSGKPKLPEGWIKFLKQDLNAKLSVLAVSKK